VKTVVTVRRIGNSLGAIFPRKLVEARGLHEGDRVEIDPKPVKDLRPLYGILRKWGAPSAYELNKAINEGEEL
jgi:hypothetical protein